MYALAAPAIEQFTDLFVELVIFRGQRAAGRTAPSVSIFWIRPLYERAATVGDAFSGFHRTADRSCARPLAR